MFCHPRIRGSFFKCAAFPLSMQILQILQILKIFGGIVSWLIVCLLCMFPTWICVQYSTVHCFEHRHEISCQRKQQKPEEGSYISDYFVPPALEGGPSDGMLGGMSIPRGMTRRAMSYDESLEGPMSPLPTDINISNLWKRPVIPDRKFQRLAEVGPVYPIH